MNKISIVVAVYNAEKTLEKCVNSLLKQTYENLEIILVNDSSSDNSFNICKKYSIIYSNVVTINNLVNLGVSATRNIGIEKSTGDYICFVDSDDYVEANYVEELYCYFKKYNTVPICGFVYHDDYNRCKPVDYTWSGGNELVSLGEAFKLNDELYLTALWNKLFDNRFIKSNNIRFDENLSMGEDLRFSVEYFQKTNVEHVFAFSHTLYHYTKLTNTTLMSQFARNGIENGIKNLCLIKELAIKYNNEAEKLFLSHVDIFKNNIIYLIVRDEALTNRDKLLKIREINPDYSKLDFLKAKLLYLKEKIYFVIYNRNC